MQVETTVTDANQTQVPAKVRKALGVEPGDVAVWRVLPDGTVSLRFRKRLSIWDLAGTMPGLTGGDAVAAKKAIQRGDRP